MAVTFKVTFSSYSPRSYGMLWILSTADKNNYRCFGHRVHCSSAIKDQELNIYIAYFFCANNRPELHPQLFVITCPKMEPSLYVLTAHGAHDP